MKILFFCHYYAPEGAAGGIRATALTERWAAAGHDVTVVTCVPNYPNGVPYDGYSNKRCEETINGVRVVRVKTYIAENKGVLKRMFFYFSYFCSALWTSLWLPKPDVAVASSPHIFAGYAGVWYHRLKRVPLVMEVRDIWPESIIAVGAKIPKLGFIVLEAIERAMYRVCQRLVVLGEGYRVRLIEKGVPAEKMEMVMNGTNLEKFYPQAKNADILRKYDLEGKFVVSYIGAVGMACGLSVVLDAAEKLKGKPVCFVIVGDGAQRVSLESAAKGKGLDNVVFTGKQPPSDMPKWVASSDACLVHLRKTDLFTTVMPSKVFEAAGCKRPIIMGVDGYAKKLVLDANAGLDMTPEDANSLVSCVEKLMSDPQLCKQLGENSYANIAKIHNRDQQAKDYLEILRKVAK